MTKPRKRPSASQSATRERIVQAFSVRAKRGGIRSVAMAELASDLRMSPNTLYQHFASKNDLVVAAVEDWVLEAGASDAAVAQLKSPRSAVEGMTRWAEAWSKSVARYSPAFWEDLRRDHPEAFAIFQRALKKRKERGAAVLRPRLLPELNPDVALALLDLILTRAADPRVSEKLGVTRSETIRTAIGIWARGALRNRGELKEMPKK